MLSQASGLSAIAFLIYDVLANEYGVDATDKFRELGIDESLRLKPGARLSTAVFRELIGWAVDVTGDSCFGIKLGNAATPSTYFVLGHAWFASSTLEDAMRRLARYNSIISSAFSASRFEKIGDLYRLSDSYPDMAHRPRVESLDAEAAGLMMLCEKVMGRRIYPVKVTIMEDEDPHPEEHQALFRAPVICGAPEYAMYFRAEDVESPLASSIPEVAEATDIIAKRYLDEVGGSKVAAQVRRLLIQMLPAGSADQETIASKLYRSASTLQRQLSAEGTSFRDVTTSTRQSLAEGYLKSGDYSNAQIAYMLGFSDQSNFSRAFKRWTGKSPGEFQKTLA